MKKCVLFCEKKRYETRGRRTFKNYFFTDNKIRMQHEFSTLNVLLEKLKIIPLFFVNGKGQKYLYVKI